MEPQMQYLRAPQDHVKTWRGVGRAVFWAALSTAILLGLMALTLL